MKIKPAKQKDFYAATRSQLVFWKAGKSLPKSFFNLMFITRLKRKICLKYLNRVLNDMVIRNEALRVNFFESKGQLFQKINDSPKIKINSFIDLSSYDKEKAKEEVGKILKREEKRSLNPKRDFLFQFKLIKFSSMDFALVVLTHHLVFDFESKLIFRKELFQLYDYYIGKQKRYPFAGTSQSIKYHDYLDWENRNDFKKQENYWLDKFSNGLPLLKLPVGKTRKSKNTQRKSNLRSVFFKPEQLRIINKLCRDNRATYFDFFMSTFSIFLSVVGQNKNVLVGTTANLRKREEFTGLIGMLMSTICVKNKIKKTDRFEDFLPEISKNNLEALNNSDMPFSYFLEKNNVRGLRDRLAAQVFFEAFYHTDGYLLEKTPTEIKQIFSLPKSLIKKTPFEMEQVLKVIGEVVQLQLVFNGQLFSQNKMDRLFREYLLLLEKAISKPALKIANLVK